MHVDFTVQSSISTISFMHVRTSHLKGRSAAMENDLWEKDLRELLRKETNDNEWSLEDIVVYLSET